MGKKLVVWRQLELIFSLQATPIPEFVSGLFIWQSIMAMPITILAAAAVGVTDGKHPCRSCPGCADRDCLAIEAYKAGLDRRFEDEVERPSTLGGLDYGTAY
jgi:hypothetical protein